MQIKSSTLSNGARKLSNIPPLNSSLGSLVVCATVYAICNYGFSAANVADGAAGRMLFEVDPTPIASSDPTEEDTGSNLRSNNRRRMKALKKDSGSYTPISCHQMLDEQMQLTDAEEIEKVDDPNKGVIYAKQVEKGVDKGDYKMDNKFWVSLHNKEFDGTRWSIMKFGEYYETALSDDYVEVLSQLPGDGPLRVIDVGGNIGYFTHLAAAVRPDVIVDAFEPNAKNRLRFCESLRLNQNPSEFDDEEENNNGQHSRVNLYPFGVGEDDAILQFQEMEGNPGQGHFIRSTKPSPRDMRIITLDGLARERGWLDDERPDIAILKIDVEGMDPKVVFGAKELLKAQIVRNVFMEVSAGKGDEGDNRNAIIQMRQAGYRIKKYGGYRGPNKDFTNEDASRKDSDDVFGDKVMKMVSTLHKGAQLNTYYTSMVQQNGIVLLSLAAFQVFYSTTCPFARRVAAAK